MTLPGLGLAAYINHDHNDWHMQKRQRLWRDWRLRSLATLSIIRRSHLVACRFVRRSLDLHKSHVGRASSKHDS